MFRMTKASEEFQKLIAEGSDSRLQEKTRNYLTTLQKRMGWAEERRGELGERI